MDFVEKVRVDKDIRKSHKLVNSASKIELAKCREER